MAIISENIVADLSAYVMNEGSSVGPRTEYEGRLYRAPEEEGAMKLCPGCKRVLHQSRFEAQDMGIPGALCLECRGKGLGRQCPKCGSYKLPARFGNSRECRDCKSDYFHYAKQRWKSRKKN